MTENETDKWLDKAAEAERKMVSQPEFASEWKRKANLYFRKAMSVDGTPMPVGVSIL